MQITPGSAKEGAPFSFEGGLVVHDKTDGLVRVIFEGYSPFQPRYRLFIGNLKIISPTLQDWQLKKMEMAMVKTLHVKGKRTLSIQKEGDFIHIKGGETPIYVDLTQSIKERGEVLAYKYTSYLPRDIDAQEAVQIVEKFKDKLFLFKIKIALYNRHGVALLGHGGSFYFANPDQDQLTRQDAEVMENELMTVVKTKSLYFEDSVFGRFMNNEPAFSLISD